MAFKGIFSVEASIACGAAVRFLVCVWDKNSSSVITAAIEVIGTYECAHAAAPGREPCKLMAVSYDNNTIELTK